MSSNFHSDGTLFIVSGPSGAGKTTLITAACSQLEPIGITLYFSVSHTTRKARAGEAEGKNYYFVSHEKFRGMIDRGCNRRRRQVDRKPGARGRRRVAGAVGDRARDLRRALRLHHLIRRARDDSRERVAACEVRRHRRAHKARGIRLGR